MEGAPRTCQVLASPPSSPLSQHTGGAETVLRASTRPRAPTLQTPAGCRPGVSRPHGLRAQSCKTAPTSGARQGLQRSAALLTTWLQIRGFRDPLVRCSHLLWQLLELREAPSYILQLVIKGVMKDTKEQSVGEVRGARSGTVPSAGVSALAELGWATLLARGCVHHPRSFPSSVAQRPLWKLRHVGIIGINFISSPPYLSLRLEAGAESSKFLIRVWLFWGPPPPAAHQELSH